MRSTARRGQNGAGHPVLPMLSLFAGAEHSGKGWAGKSSARDLSWVNRMRIRRHLVHCGRCEQQVAAIRAGSIELRRQAETETLTSFEAIADWSRLERDMVGNIAVGLAAARCIDHVKKSRKLLVGASIAAALTVVFALGWTTHIPREQTERIFRSIRGLAGNDLPHVTGTVLRSLPDGVAVHSQGSVLTILHPRWARISVTGGSAVEARFVDEDTGQVTITSVYGQ